MKTRDDHLEEQQSDNPLHANWPLIRITAYMLLGGILMALILKISPPENLTARPSVTQAKTRR